MRITDRIKAAVRAWKVGPGVVDSWDSGFGKLSEDYQPSDYVNYLATSNAVYVCANLRANLLASMPVRLYRSDSQGNDTEVTQGELYDLLETPNPFYTLSRLVKITELSLCLWGEAFWCLERGTSGKQTPKELWWARSDRMRVYPHPVDYLAGFGYDNSGTLIPFQPQEVVWLRFPNPADEYEGLAPLAAARLAADVASSAMKSNKAIFDNGLQIGGILSPPKDGIWTEDQAKDLERDLSRRFQGVDKAHRIAVLRSQAEWQSPELTPADAQFSEALQFSLEEVARAFSVPLDFIGGQRTYENVDAANKAVWTHCILPEASFIEDELNRQLVPMFPGVTRLEFDASQIEALQEDRAELVQQMQTLYQIGVPLNALLDEFMPQLKPDEGGFPWGDEPGNKPAPAPMMIAPPQAPAATPEPVPEEVAEEPIPERKVRSGKRSLEYGSPEHHRLWSHFVRGVTRWEQEVKRVVVNLFERQRDSIIDKMGARKQLVESELDKWFPVGTWTTESKKAIQSVLTRIVEDGGQDALEMLGLDLSFAVTDPRVTAFILGRSQRFAEFVTDTTWQLLKDKLNEGMKEGESISELADRVKEVMGDRIESSAETIARTEVIGASNGGTMEAWKQSGVVKGKTWLSALDDRTRGGPEHPNDEFNHYDCHGETLAIDEPVVGTGEELMYPGDENGSAGNVISCRCTLTAVLDIDWNEDE